jgi:hypothetical protein
VLFLQMFPHIFQAKLSAGDVHGTLDHPPSAFGHVGPKRVILSGLEGASPFLGISAGGSRFRLGTEKVPEKVKMTLIIVGNVITAL